MSTTTTDNAQISIRKAQLSLRLRWAKMQMTPHLWSHPRKSSCQGHLSGASHKPGRSKVTDLCTKRNKPRTLEVWRLQSHRSVLKRKKPRTLEVWLQSHRSVYKEKQALNIISLAPKSQICVKEKKAQNIIRAPQLKIYVGKKWTKTINQNSVYWWTLYNYQDNSNINSLRQNADLQRKTYVNQYLYVCVR